MQAPPPPPPGGPSQALVLPLPPNWTENRAPNGQLYYYNTVSKESTYIRPPPLAISFQPQQLAGTKEKPVEKVPIPGTEYIRVLTNKGNVFWNHKPTKQSLWVMPEEIREEVEKWEKTKDEVKDEEELDDAQDEVDRIKAEVEQEIATKRKASEEAQKESDAAVVSKKARVDDEGKEEDEQRAMLEEMASTDAVKELEPKPEAIPKNTVSTEEAKALFKTLLQEKQINHLSPWDTTLPLIIRDPRYLLLSLSLRKEVFDEYCRERAREVRSAKLSSTTDASISSKAGKEKAKEEYRALLKEEVRSTRLTWTEFRKGWKKDRRFWEFGRDDRERERAFKDWLRELGEIKRASAKQAEENFYKLLREEGNVSSGSTWKEVKKALVSDLRYDAVGSSSLREELFETYLKAIALSASEDKETACKADSQTQTQTKLEKRQKALQEREQQINAQMRQVTANIESTRAGTTKEEGEAAFQTLLTDAVREPSTTWERELEHLKDDPRFALSPLPLNDRLRFFHAHINKLRQKHLENLHALFLSHAPKLDAKFTSLPIESLRASLPASKLKLSTSELEASYARWQRERSTVARQEFDAMLGENAFLEFWGRAGKSKLGDGEGWKVDMEDDDLAGEEAGEGDEERKDLRELAKGIDFEEVERVLKNDKRYRMFDHLSEQREQWVRDYMQRMAAPKLSVHTA